MTSLRLHHLASLVAMCSVAACTTDGADDGASDDGTSGRETMAASANAGDGSAGTTAVDDSAGTTDAETAGSGSTGTSNTEDSGASSSTGESGYAEVCTIYAAKALECESPIAGTALMQCQMYVAGEELSVECQTAFAEVYACLTALDCEEFNDLGGGYCPDEVDQAEAICFGP